ncbi:MAG: hypothetical protein WD875_12565 [Pirellulales bacterium]
MSLADAKPQFYARAPRHATDQRRFHRHAADFPQPGENRHERIKEPPTARPMKQLDACRQKRFKRLRFRMKVMVSRRIDLP